MLRSLFAVCLPFLLLVSCSRDPGDQASLEDAAEGQLPATGPSPTFEILVKAVEERMVQGGVPGVSVAQIRGFELAGFQGLGLADAASGTAVSEDTLFEAASLTKPVFAYLVLLLAERGEIDLDRPLSEILPHPDLDDPRRDLLTARQVLSHTTGLPNWRPRRWTDSPGPLVLSFEPGERFSYSGEGFEYLRLVVEHLTGSSLEELARREVFEPLEMASSTFAFTGPDSARPHDFLGEVGEKRMPVRANAAGSLHTTAGDYARFLLEVLRPNRVSEAVVESMLTPQVQAEGGISWGLGWGLEDAEATFWHWGDNGDFRCFVMASRSTGDGLVLLTNSNNGLAITEPVFSEVFGDGHPAFAWLGYDSYEAPTFELRHRLVRTGIEGGAEGVETLLAELEPTHGEVLAEGYVNSIGYNLLGRRKTAAAVAVFRWNAETYPEAWNTHDSLGEALAASGDVAAAIASYERSLELNPDNDNAAAMLGELRGR